MSDLPDELQAVDPVIDRAIAQIMEHVDTVRIFVTKAKDDSGRGTLSYSTGGGNYHAQYGQIKEWVLKQEHSFCHQDEDDE